MKKISRVAEPVISIVLSLVILFGLGGFVYDYYKMGEKELADFIWELIVFCFVIATLLTTFRFSNFTKEQNTGIAAIGIIFVFAGIFLLFGCGVFWLGVYIQQIWLQGTGVGILCIALMMISISIALMTVELVKPVLKKKKK